MAIRFENVTLNGSAQSLHPLSATVSHRPVNWLRIESETGNADVKVGDSSVSSSTYGFTVEAGPTKSKDIGPFGGGDSPFNLENVFVIGTNAQKIHIAYTTV